MSDLGAATWSETDASNNANPPNGWPEGMQPSGVNNSARSNMGGEKRFWNRINAIKTTAGGPTTYTLTYDQAQAQYYDGEIHSFVVNATCAAAATLNIDGLGARQLRLFGGNLMVGAMIANQIISVRYNLAATAFDILTTQGWTVISTQSVTNAAALTFSGIPTAVKALQLNFRLVPVTSGASLWTRTAGADGNFDSGAIDYSYVTLEGNSTAASSTDDIGQSEAVIATAIRNTASGDVCSGATKVYIGSTSPAFFTWGITEAAWLNTNPVHRIQETGWRRIEADLITGIQKLSSSGNITGTGTLLACV